MQENKQVTKTAPFVELRNLTKEDVRKLSIFPVKLRRSLNRSGLQTSVTLMINDLNLQLSLVSSQRLPNGNSTQLRYFLPDVFIALIMDLGLKQTDENNKDINEWTVQGAVRFVKGNNKSGNDYHSLEIIFKQYKYHVHFLTPPQLTILNALAGQKKILDIKGKQVKLDWQERPDAIDDMEFLDDFAF